MRQWKVSQLDEIARRLIDSEQQYLAGFLQFVRERKWEPHKFVRPDLTLKERKYEPIDPILVLLDRVAPGEASPEMTLYERKEKFQTDKVRDLLSTLRRLGGLTILGDPGSGKTTCLYQLGVELANRALLSADIRPSIPLFMPLNEFTDSLPEIKKSGIVTEFVKRQLQQQAVATGSPDLSNRLDTLVRDGRAVFLFDALDEMPRDGYYDRFRALSKFVKSCAAANPRNLFVFTCRRWDHYDDPTFPTQQAYLTPFSNRQIKDFFRRYVPKGSSRAFGTFASGSGDLALQARSPFFLSLVSACVQANVPPGSTWNVLIANFVDVALDEERKRRGCDKAEWQSTVTRLKHWLSSLAFDAVESRATGTKIDATMVTASLASFGKDRDLLAIASSCGLLRKLGSDNSIKFEHHRLQEYFAALRLADFLDRDEVEPYDYIDDVWWREVILMTSGIMNHPDRLIDQILDAAEDLRFEEYRGTATHFSRVMTAMACYRPASHKLPLNTRDRMIEYIVQFLQYGNILQKVRALRVAPQFDDERVFVAVRHLLRDPSHWVREVALGILGESAALMPQLAKELHVQMFGMARAEDILVQGLRDFPILFRARFTRWFLPMYVVFAAIGLIRAGAFWIILVASAYAMTVRGKLSTGDLLVVVFGPIVTFVLLRALARRGYARFRWQWMSTFNGCTIGCLLLGGTGRFFAELFGRIGTTNNTAGAIGVGLLNWALASLVLYLNLTFLLRLYLEWRDRRRARWFDLSSLQPDASIDVRRQQAQRLLEVARQEKDRIVRGQLIDKIKVLLPLDESMLEDLEEFCDSELEVDVRTKAFQVYEAIELSVERERWHRQARGQDAQ